jgi:toxin ParE1/3/4
MDFEVSAAAYRDVRATVVYYQQRPGRYGAKFLHEFNRALSAIENAPKVFAPVEEDVGSLEIREYYIERFQQRVIYLIFQNRIEVLAVLHASALATRWLNRVPKSDDEITTEGTSP